MARGRQLENLCRLQQGGWCSVRAMSIAENVKRIRNKAGLSQPGLAKLAGVSQQLISQIENEKNTSTKALPRIAKALGVPVAEIDPSYAEESRFRAVPIGEEFAPDPEWTEDETRTSVARNAQRRTLQPGEIVERDVVAGLGIGGDVGTVVVDGVVQDDVRGIWRLPPDFIRTELRSRETDLDFITVEGDSMAPTLLPGDKVLISRAYGRASDGVFVIHDGLGPSVKRLEVLTGTNPLQIRILADNPHHTPREIFAEDLQLIGRVIGRFTRM